ncbi:MAG: D-alanyl-D-alanine carboxypeptidase/D-alanyl-D-alanine-endopeptidase [Candidatus Sumerlaeaceae bacterium]|nr:D-alanyl-D-alanine carboxypeptidase/D-alanyl-D-alanine-endopeptidase [Candidatus Sumerlaeaceae bacterium]
MARFASRLISLFAVVCLALPTHAKPTATRAKKSAAKAAVTTSIPSLQQQIEKLVVPNPLRAGTVGVYAVDAKTGKVLVNINGETPLKPASCNKLITTAAGLTILGPNFKFVTELLRNGDIQNGTLQGDLIVKGGGDPTISGRFEKNKKDVTATMRQFAQKLKAAGITQITGDLIADDRIFDRIVFHPTWYPRERGEWYEAEIWGLSFNDNCVDLTWSAKGQLAGDRVNLVINPPNTYANVKNEVRVAATGRDSGRSYRREDRSNDIIATGALTIGTEKEDSASIYNGAEYFLSVFRDVLTSEGITVAGKSRLIDEKKDAAAATKAVSILKHESPPLSEVLAVINRNSQNFYADSLIKMLGRIKREEGSFTAGTSVAHDFCLKNGLYAKGHEMVDGSGLSPKNKVSPRQLVEIIRFMDKGPNHDVWRNSLPIGGNRGTLKARFQQTTESQALASRIYGKTGLIGGVRSLSGIVTGTDGRDIYYCVNANDFSAAADEVLNLLDKVAVTMAREVNPKQ